MSFSGELSTMSLPDVLQWIAQTRKTGTLLVDNGKSTRRFDVETGSVTGVRSSSAPALLGWSLVEQGLVTRSVLEHAVELQKEYSKSAYLGKVLVDIGALAEPDINRTLRLKIQENILELLENPQGDFHFVEHGASPRSRVPVTIDINDVLLASVHELDESNANRVAIPIPKATPEPVVTSRTPVAVKVTAQPVVASRVIASTRLAKQASRRVVSAPSFGSRPAAPTHFDWVRSSLARSLIAGAFGIGCLSFGLYYWSTQPSVTAQFGPGSAIAGSLEHTQLAQSAPLSSEPSTITQPEREPQPALGVSFETSYGPNPVPAELDDASPNLANAAGIASSDLGPEASASIVRNNKRVVVESPINFEPPLIDVRSYVPTSPKPREPAGQAPSHTIPSSETPVPVAGPSNETPEPDNESSSATTPVLTEEEPPEQAPPQNWVEPPGPSKPAKEEADAAQDPTPELPERQNTNSEPTPPPPVQPAQIEPPVLVRQPQAKYPWRALRLKQEAEVTLRVLVDTRGTIIQAELAPGQDIGRDFVDSAMAAAKTALYQPASQAGKPVRVWTNLRIAFRLN